jgi:hypothetical protein
MQHNIAEPDGRKPRDGINALFNIRIRYGATNETVEYNVKSMAARGR